MGRKVEFFFDFGSPASYLAATQIDRIAAEAGAVAEWRPFLIAGVFKETGNVSPASIPAKGRWMFRDLVAWSKRWGAPFRFNPHFPILTLQHMRIATAYRDDDRFRPLCDAMFRAIWVEERDMNDPAIVAEVVAAAGIAPEEATARAADQAVKDALKAATDEALSRGAFGAPTFFVGDQMFFGQDRLDFVAEALVA